jgi:hypothetical protein
MAVQQLGDLGSREPQPAQAAIAWIVCSSVRLATTAGAEE